MKQNEPLTALLTQIGGLKKDISKKSGITTQHLNDKLRAKKTDVEFLIHVMKANGVTQFKYGTFKIEIVL